MLANILLYSALALVFPMIVSLSKSYDTNKGSYIRYLPAFIGASFITLLYAALAVAKLI